MIRLGSSWTITLADLSLILFMVTAMAVRSDREEAAKANPLPAEGEPVAVYRAATGAPPLRTWLQGQQLDDRLQLTIIGRYAGKDAATVSAEATRLAAEAGPQGVKTRILVEPGAQQEVLAVLSYDRAPDWHGDCSTLPVKGQGPGKDMQCD